MRIMGLDFGSKTVGVAISDALLLTAQGIEIIRRKSPSKLRQTLARIDELKNEYEVEKIVLGVPKNMNNTEGDRCEKTQEFKEMLEKKYGKAEAAKRIYATTDKARGALKKLATEEGYETFVVPDDVGGRFSVLTAVGLLPIADS